MIEGKEERFPLVAAKDVEELPGTGRSAHFSARLFLAANPRQKNNKRWVLSGIFISIEGGEGAANPPNQIALNWIAGVWPGKVTQTREPGGTHGAELIRELLVSGDESRWDSITEALLMTAARRDNLMRIIRPALDDGDAVITDRFYDSTFVYQGIVGGVDRNLIEALNRFCLDAIVPDVTIARYRS